MDLGHKRSPLSPMDSKECDFTQRLRNFLSEHMPADSSWANLPSGPLALILGKLRLLSHYLRFRVTCKSWYTIAREEQDRRRAAIGTSHIDTPLLLVPAQDRIKEKRALYDVLQKKILQEVRLPFGIRCVGSSYGTLFYSTESCFVIHNPFRRITRELPAVVCDDVVAAGYAKCEGPEQYGYFVGRVAISCDPFLYEHDFEIAVIYALCNQVAVFKAGDEKWTHVDFGLEDAPLFSDILYHNGAFYILNEDLSLLRIDMITGNNGNTRSYSLEMVAPRLDYEEGLDEFGSYDTYLAESTGGNLLNVLRFQRVDDTGSVVKMKTIRFKLYKLATDNGTGTWVEIGTLGGDTLFLGNPPITINTNEIVEYGRNRIYYLDDRGYECRGYKGYGAEGWHDMGIYDVESRDCSESSFYELEESNIDMPPALWIVPTI